MESWLLIVRLVLVGIFLLAGVAKFLDLKGSEKAFQDFGIPKAIALPSSIALSIAEIVIGLLFLHVDTSWLAAVGASALLLLFIVQMSYQMAKGNAPDCHCFGQVHSAPVGKLSIFRNGVFAVFALTLVVRGQTGQGRSLADPTLDVFQLAFGIVLSVLLVAVIFYLRKLSEQQTQLIRRIDVMDLVARESGEVVREEARSQESLPIGAVFPSFELPDTKGSAVTLEMVRMARRPVLFLFVSPTCNPCRALVPEFAEWRKNLEGRVDIVLISNGKAEDNIEKFASSGVGRILLQKQRELAERVKAPWTPAAILVDEKGRIASRVATGDAPIRELLEKIRLTEAGDSFYFLNQNGHGGKSKIGSSIPSFSTTSLDGQPVTADDFHGRETLVAFWSQHCSHCVNMIDDLREWDKKRLPGSPNLVVFTDGDQEFLNGLHLTSPVIHDPGHKTSATLGMHGTPSAVLVDEKGVIVSETAMGAEEIWSLVGR
ncbi:MAG: MauE/DoxX family redox-associated membrane protein [Pyrinomonadaceae bacterium]